MIYELAKQLKDAGFPQEGEGKWWDKNANEFQSLSGNTSNFAYAPILSELIEACGEYENIQLRHNGELVELHFDNQNICRNAFGGTIEEAFAHLWLALHTKA